MNGKHMNLSIRRIIAVTALIVGCIRKPLLPPRPWCGGG